MIRAGAWSLCIESCRQREEAYRYQYNAEAPADGMGNRLLVKTCQADPDVKLFAGNAVTPTAMLLEKCHWLLAFIVLNVVAPAGWETAQ